MKLKTLLFLIAVFFVNTIDAKEQTPTDKVIGGYFITSSIDIKKIPYQHYTHLYQSFLRADSQGNVRTNFGNKALVDLAHKNKCKILISLGGGAFKLFPTILDNKTSTQNYIQGIIKILKDYGYDGVDIDYEHPNSTKTGKAWSRLVIGLHNAMENLSKTTKKQYLLTTALPSGDWVGKHIDTQIVNKYIDLLNVMAYDAYGSWTNTAGCHAPLNPIPEDPRKYSMKNFMKYWEDKGVNKNILCFGMPFYGNIYYDTKPYKKVNQNRRPPRAISYKHTANLITNKKWTAHYDKAAGTTWLYSPDKKSFATIDDEKVIKQKTLWAKQKNYRGVFCWAIYHDSPAHILSKTMHDSFKQKQKQKVKP